MKRIMVFSDRNIVTTFDDASDIMDEIAPQRSSVKGPSHYSCHFDFFSCKKSVSKERTAKVRPSLSSLSSSFDNTMANLKIKYQTASIFAGISMFAQQLKNHEMCELNLEMSKANENLRDTLDKTTANLRIALDQSKVELATRIEKERSNSLLLAQQQKYEILLADAIEAANTQRVVSEDFASRLSDQSKISDRLELLVQTSRLEIDQIRSLSANTAHDLKSPLHTLIVGMSHATSPLNSILVLILE